MEEVDAARMKRGAVGRAVSQTSPWVDGAAGAGVDASKTRCGRRRHRRTMILHEWMGSFRQSRLVGPKLMPRNVCIDLTGFQAGRAEGSFSSASIRHALQFSPVKFTFRDHIWRDASASHCCHNAGAVHGEEANTTLLSSAYRIVRVTDGEEKQLPACER